MAEMLSAQDVPEPPWRRARRQPAPPKAPLTREAIVEAALGLIDREGLDALSMRRVAQELGTGAASLYWHVGDKDELLDLVFDRVIGEWEVPRPDPERWQEQLKESLRHGRRALLQHGDVARIALDRWPIGPNALVMNERLLALLRAGGLPDRACAYAAQLLPSYVGWDALEQALRAGQEQEQVEERVAMVRDYFSSLPPDRFPHTLALLPELTGGDAEDRFELGLDILIAGLATCRD